MVGQVLLTLLPIAAILVMLIVFKKPADISGIVGWILISIIAFFAFKTSSEVIIRSTFAGLVKSFPVSLIVATSLLQMAYMEKSGALNRIIVYMKTISSDNKAVQIMLINIGFGTLMVAVGATPVSILPPILLAMGYSTYAAITMPAIGYDSLCTYALLGAPIVVFVDLANGFMTKAGLLKAGQMITLTDAGKVFSVFLPLVSTLIGLSMLYIADRWQGIRKGLLPCLVTGVVIGVVSHFTNRVENLVALTGVICGISVIIAMVIYLKVTGRKLIDRSKLTEEDLKAEASMPLWKAMTPWALLVIIILVLNIPRPVYEFLYNLKLPVENLTADGKPIVTRALWNAYTWIFVSIIVSFPFLKPSGVQLKETWKAFIKRAPRPVFSAAVFFAIGEIMNMSGYSISAGKPVVSSMVKVLADTSSSLFQQGYGFVSAFIGLFGGFITGSEASTIGMFGNYAMTTAVNLGKPVIGIIIIAAALAFGGGLASVISPAKLQNAAASIDKLGEENSVIRIAFIFSVILTLVTSAFAVIILNIMI